MSTPPSLALQSGGVLAQPSLVLVFWGDPSSPTEGTFWRDHPDYVQVGTVFFMEFLRGFNVDRLSQYGVGIGNVAAVVTPVFAYPGDGLEAMADVGIQQGVIPPATSDTIYVYVIDPTSPYANFPNSNHGDSGGLGNGAPWVIAPLMPPPAEGEAAAGWWHTQIAFTAGISHELYESMTDPTPFNGWVDVNYPSNGDNSECCDICENMLGARGYVYPLVYGAWSIEPYWSNQDNWCVLGFDNAWSSLGVPAGVSNGQFAAAFAQNGDLVAFTLSGPGDLWMYTRSTAGQIGGSWSDGGWQELVKGAKLTTSLQAFLNYTIGLLEVFATNASGQVWHTYQTAPNGSWTAGELLGAPAGGKIVSNLAIGFNAPDPTQGGYPCLEIFAVADDGQLHHNRNKGPWKGWSGWASLSAPPPGLPNEFSCPILGSNRNGCLSVFVIGRDSSPWTIQQTTPNGGWGTWSSIPFSSVDGAALSSPVPGSWQVGQNADGRLELFTVAPSAAGLWNVYHADQLNPNANSWSDWSPLMPLGAGGAVAFQGPLSVANVTTDVGELAVSTTGSDGALWTIRQTTPSGPEWNQWRCVGIADGLLDSGNHITGITSIVGANGLNLVVEWPDRGFQALAQTSPGGTFGQILLPQTD